MARTRWRPTGRGRSERLVLGGGPGEMHLEAHRAATACLPIGGDDVAQPIEGLVDRHQPVGPGGDPARALDGDRWGDEERDRVRPLPDLRPVDADEAVVADALAGQQRADHLDALLEPARTGLLVRPGVTGDVLVGRLAAAERDPEPAGEHHPQRRDLLGHDRGVVALAGSADAPERQGRGRERGAQPAPGVPAVALGGRPRREVVRAHGHLEPGRLRLLHVPQQPPRVDLLVRGVESETSHPHSQPGDGRPSPHP